MVDSVSSNLFLALFLFLSVHGPGAKPSYENKNKLSMDLVHDRGSMDPVHESGPWTWSKEGVHGPLVHVLSSPDNDLTLYQVCYKLTDL